MTKIESHWSTYFKAKEIGIKKFMKSELQQKISEIKQMDIKKRELYLTELIKLNLDKGLNIPLQDPRIWKFVLELFIKKKEELDPEFLLYLYKFSGAKDVYKIIDMELDELLELALSLKGKDQNIAKTLALYHIDTLDFALHELPTALVINRDICIKVINRLNEIFEEYPMLKSVTNRFNCDADYYIKLFYKWDHYENKDKDIRFEEWYTA